jgi:glycerophosphoryl diester phosphodiesterase
MAGWSVVVWAAGFLVLSPLAAFVVGRLLGPEGVISNEEVAMWLVAPSGVAVAVLGLASVLVTSMFQFGGLFRLVADDRIRRAGLAHAVLTLVAGLPAVFRFCIAVVASILALATPPIAWVALVARRFLREHDINYYLSVRPPEWDRALVLTVPVILSWAIAIGWLLLRTLPALPAFFDGHRPMHAAVRVGWRLSRGRSAALFGRLVAAATLLAAVHAALASGVFLLASAVVGRVAEAATSVGPVLVATAVTTAVTSALGTILGFLGFAWLSALLGGFYLDQAHDAGLRAETPSIAPRPAVWLTPRRAALLGITAVSLNAAATITTLETLSDPPDPLIIAHRAGAHLAPENTLLALDRAIEARADLAEIDVQRTRDGVLVVVHDTDLMRVARDPRTIAGTDFAAFAGIRQGHDDGSPPEERRLATLSEFLERARGRIGLAVELKYYGWDPQLADQALAEIRASGLERQVLILSLSLPAIRQVQLAAPEISTAYLSSVAVGSLSQLPVKALALARLRATASVVRDAHLRGLEVYVWTVNDASSMIEMIGRGADGIITDDPLVGARIRDEVRSLTSTEMLLLRFSDVLTDEDEQGDSMGEP